MIDSISEKLFIELNQAQNEALDRQELVEPSEEERKNGWTAETLTEYLASRNAGQSLSIAGAICSPYSDTHSLHRKIAQQAIVQNHRYNPHKWRG